MSRVTILFRNNRISVEPDTVYLSRGEALNWDLRVDQEWRFVTRFKWEIYFSGRSPFSYGNARSFSLETRSFTSQELSAGLANLSGEYKYGVRLRDASTNTTIEDEDPFIVVR